MAFEYHPEYNKYKGLWLKIRDVIEGEEAVKAKKDTYLPKRTKQSDKDYKDST